MGTWNSGNFDNDTAADLISEQREKWINTIQGALRLYDLPHTTPLDVEDDVMTYLEMILRIASPDRAAESEIEQILAPSILPRLKQVKDWQEIVVTKHLKYFGKDESASGRFTVIKATFERLIALYDKAEQQDRSK